jgi:hypothetical protein
MMDWKGDIDAIFPVFVPAAAVITVLAESPASYHITQLYALGGEGRCDYVVPAPPRHRVFVARQTRVMVIDEDKGTLAGRSNRHQASETMYQAGYPPMTARSTRPG